MFKLMREQQLIAESTEDIVFNEQESAWVTSEFLYCDIERTMYVVDTEAEQNIETPPNVVG